METTQIEAEKFVNKVEESGILTIDLESFLPSEEISLFDLKDYLFMGLILKEKDFREALKNMDWSAYKNKIVAVTCSADAVIPMWAYMLLASNLQPVAKEVFYGDINSVTEKCLSNNISNIKVDQYRDKRVVIKGCGDKKIAESAYLEITKLLKPVAKSIMYGEPCSTVPIFKKK
ncbi:MAG: DUF2480 family protein [Ginsengibacter sp.]